MRLELNGTGIKRKKMESKALKKDQRKTDSG